MLSATTWYHVVATYDGATKDRRLYVDGIQVSNDNGADHGALAEYLRIGDDSNASYHDGLIDEVRVSSIARSADWIQTTYNNQFAPGTFYGVGPEDSSPPVVNGVNSCVVEAPCQGIGSGTCNYRSIGTRGDYGTAEADGGGTTVSAIASSSTIAGAGTTWLSSNRGRGDRITIDGTDYTILSVDSETQLTLTSGFTGSTGAGKSYTIARKFATPRSWENCIDGPGGAGCEGVSSSDLVADNRGEVGVIFNDGPSYTYLAVSSPILNINGSTTDATHTITLTVEPGNRHNGTAGTGVVLDNNVNDTWAVAIQDEYATVEWLSITGGATTGAAAFNVVAGAQDNHITIGNNIIHNISGRGVRINSVDARVDVINNLVYETGSQPLRINQTLANGSRVRILNNTFYNPTGGGLSSVSGSNPHLLLRNNIIYDSSAGFNVSWINVGSSNNLSDDAAPPMFPVPPFTSDTGHSPGGGGVYGASVASANFVDTTPGTENLHIQSGSTAENVAADLSAIFSIDIDGLMRDAPWDIGADEFSATDRLRSIGIRDDYGTAEIEGPGTTLTATNGSALVSGAGTMWRAANRGRGDRITIGLVDYTILSVDSENQLTLTEVFAGTSGSGKSYTIARKFDTLAQWEDCIDGPGGAGCEGVSSNSLVTDNRNETGIAYADGSFAAFVIDGSVTDTSHTITLTVDPGNRHLGIEGGGAVLDNAAVPGDAISIQDNHVTVEWLEIKNGGAGSDGVRVSSLSVGNLIVLRNLLIRDVTSSGIELSDANVITRIYNNFIYSSSLRGIMISAAPTANASVEIYNNTLFANTFQAIDSVGSGSRVVVLRNNVATNNTPFDYTVNAGLITATSSHNLSTDGSAAAHSPGGGAVSGVLLASLNFVSTTGTYVDLHIQNGSTAEGVGTDLSSEFVDDIDGETRTGTWDMGADAITTGVFYRSIGTRPHYGNAGPEGVGTSVTATTGSNIVTGAGGTTWSTSNRGRGDRVTINGVDYTVLRVDSDTQLVLTGPFEQASGSGLTYSIERKFTTLAAWEQCVDNTTPCPGVVTSSLVADNRREVGIAYADTAFGASVAIEGATTDQTRFITLTADHGNRHYGLAGTGVYIVGTEVLVENDYTVVEWLEVRTSAGAGFRVRDASSVLLQYLISQGNNNGVQMSGAGGNSFTIRNSIIYGNGNDGIAGDEATDLVTVENCTVFGNIDQGIEDNNSPFIITNTISMGNGANDYSVLSVTGSNNISSDASTAGTGTLTNRTATDNQTPGAGDWVIFQNIAATFENLHLGGNAENDALDTATNLSSSFNVDIDGGVRALPWDVGADDFVATTVVELVLFEAHARDGGVELRWETASELDNLGFNLYRALSAEGPYERITPALIPGLGSSPAGAGYSFRDVGLDNGTTYFYQLEDVDASSETTLHGPVFATPSEQANDGSEDGDAPDEEGARIRYGDPEANSIEIVRRGRFDVIITLETQGFYAVPLADGTVRLEIPEFASDANGVPLRLAWIEALAGRRVDLESVRGKRVDVIENLVPAGELVEAHAALDGTVRAGSRRNRRVRIRGADLARVVSVAFQGEEKKALIELSPMHWDGERLLLAQRVVVRLSLRRRDRKESSSGRRRLAARNARGVFARLVTRDEGLHAVRYEDVLRGRKRLRADRLELRRGGEAVPFRLEPNTTRFGPGSTLLFVSDGPRANPYGNEAVYELARGADAVHMVETSAAAATSSGETVYWDTVEREENTIYQAGLVEAPDIWLWALLMGSESKSFSFDVHELATGDGALRVWLQGTSDLDVVADHHVSVFINGTYVADTRFDGKAAVILEAPLLSGALVEGENVLTIENVGDTDAAYSMVMLDRFEVTYPRRVVAREAYVLDVTNAPEWLVDIESNPDGTSAIRFAADPERRYLVVPVDSVHTPEVRAPRRALLRNRHRADYIAIGPSELLDAIEPLLAHRRQQGLRVKTASVEAIYNEFGFGEARPQAIRDFLAYAYHEWRRPSPRYVVLVGDATYDFKDDLKTGVTNGVPPYMVKTSYLWTASDPTFAAVNGDDWLPDLAIGRLPVSSPEEAAKLAEKIIRFESGGYVFGDAPVVLVTDNADAAGDFDANADELAQGLLSRFDPVRLSLSALGRDPMRDAIVRSFDDGASLISYIGHGGIHLWASENIFNRSDVALLSAQPRQPLLLTMNCLNGYFHFPYFDSLAEALVTAEDRGAVAAFSPSGLSLDEPAHRFHKILLEALLDEENMRLGDAVLAAQKGYLETGAFPELLRIYHLFGDPALTLR